MSHNSKHLPTSLNQKRRISEPLASAIVILTTTLLTTVAMAQDIEKRDPYLWPFSVDSIWNTPIGSNAKYVPANIQVPTRRAMTVDEDVIINTPTAPLKEVYTGGWSKAERCVRSGQAILQLPIPDGFDNSDTPDDATPNHASAVLMSDGMTYYQSQPLSVCENGAFATTTYVNEKVNLYGLGHYGSHGGSGLSSVGGTIRLGELVPGGKIRHALKVNLFAGLNLYYPSDGSKDHRWPARKADTNADKLYGGQNKALMMGSLLALKPDFDHSLLKTEPGKILAQAFKDYGAYVVDDTAWDVYALVTESGPNGSVVDEFKENWGYDIEQPNRNNEWAQDVNVIFQNVHVIENNTRTTVGGGGTPRAPRAPDFNAPGLGHKFAD